ncbi:hypothetical protein HK096_007749 [Nowakowskiella sp. JEL0078]|nr:hypothetical protein HK096_007749 [Nowakowskiella sp. JEL0078]
MEAKIAGQIVVPSPSGEKGMCRIVQIADGDLKGSIPSRVISFVATQSVPQSFKALDKALVVVKQVNVSQALLNAEKGDALKVVTHDGKIPDYVESEESETESEEKLRKLEVENGAESGTELTSNEEPKEIEKSLNENTKKKIAQRTPVFLQVLRRMPFLQVIWKLLA